MKLTNQFLAFGLLLLCVGNCPDAMAQRKTDQLDRGLIAVPAAKGYQVSWRLLGEEYYDVTYNLYRDGALIASNLNTSNYNDKEGVATSQYTVSAVVRGVEQQPCAAVTPWTQSYKLIKPTHEGIKSTLTPNDACCADVDGDGELEILMKYDNASEMSQSYPKMGPKIDGVNTEEYSIFEVLKLDGTRLWWVNCGPNMGDFQNNEQNIVGYDWDCDGKSEVLMRLSEGSTIHFANGSTYTIGANGQNGGTWYNYRGATGGGVNWFIHDGKEFLVYCNGQTGEIYDLIDFPLARYESNESDLNAAWGDGYGHRSSKYFFGAPYFDGHNPSIFLARGIYTRHKMIALDVDKQTHKLKERWRWYNNSNGVWKGQGFHNFGVADVDEDGRDEIVYGSLVLDDNGKGLHTTGEGHGDAQHCGDFNPYAKGLEIYDCLEDHPGNIYRDGTTGKVYHRFVAGTDDGRSMMDNFSDAFPGSIGCSAREGAISSVTGQAISGMDATGINTNFRIFWDGDLCSETYNYLNGKNTEGCVAKYGSWSPIYICEGSLSNNDTKGTPCYQGDILGDWREEIIMRDADNNIRIYSTPVATTYRIPTLWSDHQYRNSMVWQMCGYNQPPHVSYFVGKLEGILMPPPPLTTTGRVEVASGATVGADYNDKHVLLSENNDMQLTLAEGAKPYILTINVPSWVQGTAPSECTTANTAIKYQYYTCDVTAGSLAGNARLIKQGDGVLNLPATEFTHTGETRVWGGTLNFDGKMKKSDLWLNRFAKLNSNNGEFKTITALYGTEIQAGGADQVGQLTADSLCMDFGSRLVVDLADGQSDCLKLRSLLTIRKTGAAWTVGGPQYLQPVIELKGANIQEGEYVIAECEKLYGSLTNFKIEGANEFKKGLRHENGKIILSLGSTRGPATIYWTGQKGSVWDFANYQNFLLEETGEEDVFAFGDLVVFSDNAKNFNVKVTGELVTDTVKFTNETNDYTLSGDGSIVQGALVKEGAGKLTVSNMNTYQGGNYLRGGILEVASLANSIQTTGNLGSPTLYSIQFTFENGAVLQPTAEINNGSPIRMDGEEGGVINNNATFTQQKGVYGTRLTKKGSGQLVFSVANSLTRLVVTAGSVRTSGNPAQVVEMQGGTLNDNVGTSYTIHIPEGKSARWNVANRSTYTNALTGQGSLTVYSASEKGTDWYATRTPLKLNLSNFEGTLVAQAGYAADGRFTLSTASGSDKFTMNIPSGIIVQNEGKTLRIGQLTGGGSLGGFASFSNSGSSGTNTWQVGNDGNFTFDGLVIGGDAFTKLGTGVMTVSKDWTTTGKVLVTEGTVRLSSSATLGSGILEVAQGATLNTTAMIAGKAIKSSSVIIRGTLLPQVGTTATGIAAFNGQSVTFDKTGTLQLYMRRSSTGATLMSGCSIENISTLTMNGTIHIGFIGYVPQEGDVLRLWKKVTTAKGTPTVVVDNVDGMEVTVDTSRLLSEGVLVVTSVTTAIDQLKVDGSDDTFYNLQGQPVEDLTQPAGIIIKRGKKIILR